MSPVLFSENLKSPDNIVQTGIYIVFCCKVIKHQIEKFMVAMSGTSKFALGFVLLVDLEITVHRRNSYFFQTIIF